MVLRVNRETQTAGQNNVAADGATCADAPSRVRHVVVAFAFVLGLVLFIDRAALSVLAPAIRRDLNFGPMATINWTASQPRSDERLAGQVAHPRLI